MKRKYNPLFILYQIFIVAPLAIIITVICATITIILSPIYGDKKFTYYPAIFWAKAICTISLVRVKISGEGNFDSNKSYIFVANHQSVYDIFLIYGWLNTKFKWIMKKEIRIVPFVGKACESAGHIFIDRSSGIKAKRSIEKAKERLSNGCSIVLFPEGTRTRTGALGRFKKGAFSIAKDIHLPIVPITIKGAFEALPYHCAYTQPGTIEMIIHPPIDTSDLNEDNIFEYRSKVESIINSELI